jgi:hypothetical protein
MDDSDEPMVGASLKQKLVAMRGDLLLVVAVAAFVRVVYYMQYAVELPFLYGPIADSVVYLEQSFRVRHGEFGAAVLLAFSPLYGYFLALVGSGGSLITPVILQLCFGSLIALVLYLISFQLAGRTSARFSAALYLGYGTLIYYESKILSETLSLLLVLLALGVSLGPGVRLGRLRPSIVSGGLYSFAILARASLVFAAPLIVLTALLPWAAPRESFRVCFRRGIGVALGVALVLGGNGLLTFTQTGLFVPVILVSRTVETSSGRGFDGQLASVQFGEGLASSYDVVASAKRRLADAAHGVAQEASSATRIDLVGYLTHAPAKLLHTLTPREITFQYGFNGERDHVRMLQFLPVSFGLLLLWGAFGALALARERGVRALLPFAPLVIGVLVTTTLYHPSTRYRLAMILPLFLLGGVGFATLWRLENRRARWMGGALALASVFFVGLHLRSRSYNRAEFEIQLAMSAGMQGDHQAEVIHAERAVEFAPHDPLVRQRAVTLIEDARSHRAR